MRLVAGAVMLCGCFHPSPPAGIPCGANGECPGDQICDMQVSPPTCVDELADGGVRDGDDLIDAPPAGACAADSDCTAGICIEMNGMCVPDAEVLFVSPSGSGTACTRQAPCGTLQTAIDARTQARFTVALAPGMYSSSFDTSAMAGGVNNLIVSGPTRFMDDAVIMTSDLNRVHPQLVALFEGLTIRGGSNSGKDGINSRGTTTLSRVHIDEANGDGVVCADNGHVKIFDSLITKSTDDGISANGDELIVERTQVVSNGTYGIEIQGASYTIRNSIIANNGTALMPGGGVRIAAGPGGGAVSIFRFNTLARNQGLSYPSITCESQAAISNVIIGESSLVSPALSPGCSSTYSLFNTMIGAPLGTGNIMGDPKFVSATDFHLQTGSPAIDKGNPMNAEPIDIDGQQRGSAPDIGADERP